MIVSRMLVLWGRLVRAGGTFDLNSGACRIGKRESSCKTKLPNIGLFSRHQKPRYCAARIRLPVVSGPSGFSMMMMGRWGGLSRRAGEHDGKALLWRSWAFRVALVGACVRPSPFPTHTLPAGSKRVHLVRNSPFGQKYSLW